MENGITLSRDGKNYGPYSETQILQLIGSGHASPEDHAWREGMADWQPLRVVLPSCASKPPATPAKAQERVILKEDGVYISTSRIQLGSSLFVPGNIGGVSIQQEERRVVLPMVGLILFGMMTIAGFFGIFASKDKGTGIIGTFFILLPITLWCAYRCFSPRKLTLLVAAAGGMQNGLVGTDRDRMNRIAAAIQQAILTLVALLSFAGMSLQAQEASPTPEQLHLLVVKVEEQGVMADKMEPHENSTARAMKATGNPMASGMIPAGVSRAGLAAALEPVWKPSGALVFVKGSFPGIAEGDRKVVTATRRGACKITSKTTGEAHTIPFFVTE